MMKERYTSPEAKLVSFVALERLASNNTVIDGTYFFESVAKVNKEWDIPVFFEDWFTEE